jgi:hypothetical protein
MAAHRAKSIFLHVTPHCDERVVVTGPRRETDELLLALDGAVVPLCVVVSLLVFGVADGAMSVAAVLLSL